MTKAVVIGTNAYPFLIRYWYELFTRFWQDEVDRVYFAVSVPEHKSTWVYIKSLLESHPKIKVILTNTQWPKSINQVTSMVEEDLMLLMHDDTLIFKSGVVTKYFDLVQSQNKVVTPLHNIYQPKDLIEELMKRKYPDQVPFVVPETGEQGFSFYTNFCFLTREMYQKTSGDFGEWYLAPGQYSEHLDWTSLLDGWSADTNFLFTLDLLKAGVTVLGIPTNETGILYNYPNPLQTLKELVDKKEGVFSDDAGWIHLQTMAYHIYGLYFDYGEREALEKSTGGKVMRKIHNEEAMFGQHAYKWNLMIRLAWIREFMSVGDYSGIDKYYAHAQREINYMIKYIKLDQKAIAEFQQIFHRLIFR